MLIYYGTGRRKNSSSRVFMKNGNGNIVINKINIDKYVYMNLKKYIIISPMIITNLIDKFDLFITVKGGGYSSQLYAIRLGISRAIVKYNENFKNILKKLKYLTRDSRSVERKKFGLKKSRKKPQYSKR
ncbi:30S ribosomal protein S9 [endosymbiont of Pachyrhynchus infernalis]|uniref:30S ribosomal protein S9 n=1 Tax=endosymbiont of Pachyrhynchus infernalis TaxID=1971488 RepID=UPI000DC73221|nr:30S ribosomal protein S9 [endosymbiont of Pachyrhynchus infernalis]BBA84917.1 30S ribosomal protein S9 [endosymbiont of Pachyrhynchus infernalis]